MAEEKKEKTPEEIKKENEEARKIAKLNLESKLWNYAAPKLITHADYGNLAESAQGFYLEAISKAPDQNIYEQLFLPQLAREGGAVTSPYIQNGSMAILQNSLLNVTVADALAYAGYKGPLKADYVDKYVKDFNIKEEGSDRTKNPIVPMVMQYKTDDTVKGIIGSRQKQITSELEKMFGEPEKKEGEEDKGKGK